MVSLIVDTDIAGASVGASIDDGLALVAGLRHEEVSLEGVIVTGGEPGVKLAQVRRIFEVVERSAPLALGSRHDMLGNPMLDASHRPPTVEFISRQRSTHGVPGAGEVLAEACASHPGEVTVLVCGPATTLALALLARPELAKLVGRVILSAGGLGWPSDGSTLASDPHALAIVLRMVPERVTLLGRDVAQGITFTAADLELEHRGPSGSAVARFVEDYCVAWLGYHEECVLTTQDALGVLLAADERLARTERAALAVDPCNRSFPGLLVPLRGLRRSPVPSPTAVVADVNVIASLAVDDCHRELLRLWDLARPTGAAAAAEGAQDGDS